MSTTPPLMKLLENTSGARTHSLESSTVNRLRSKVAAFSSFTLQLGRLSTCRRVGSKIGCIIIPPDMSEVAAIGYNGPAAGEDHMTCRGPEAVGSCGCLHAEANALVKLKATRQDLVMIASLSPCEQCAGLIINSKAIVAVLYGTAYRDLAGIARLSAAGIIVLPLNDVLFPDLDEPKTESEASDLTAGKGA